MDRRVSLTRSHQSNFWPLSDNHGDPLNSTEDLIVEHAVVGAFAADDTEADRETVVFPAPEGISRSQFSAG